MKTPVILDLTKATLAAGHNGVVMRDHADEIVAVFPLRDERLPDGSFSYAGEVQRIINDSACEQAHRAAGRSSRERIDELIEANNRMEARARRAEAALRPFAEAAAPYLAGRMDHAVDATRVHRVLSLKIGDLRNAAKVVEKIHGGGTTLSDAPSLDAPLANS